MAPGRQEVCGRNVGQEWQSGAVRVRVCARILRVKMRREGDRRNELNESYIKQEHSHGNQVSQMPCQPIPCQVGPRRLNF